MKEARSEDTPFGRYITSEGCYPVSELAARHGASVAESTEDPDEAYADWPGDYEPVRLPWPPASP